MAEGLVLLVVGMTTVFAFLGLLVGVMHLSAMYFSRLAPPPGPEPSPSDATEIAVAIAAVRHRRNSSTSK
ncbi:MAG: hypothetical protein A2269_04350 [Lentisphaerae bacterium RIFOXYA12_FULL_60_10]|nr:MAG: hypothetical protein A2269_04350 [Lentisphaerae bacterium RIFOXYA12_FULL_60_10]